MFTDSVNVFYKYDAEKHKNVFLRLFISILDWHINCSSNNVDEMDPYK